MTDFPLLRIDELSHYLTVGFVGSMANLFTDEGVPLLRGQNIKPYSLDLSNLKFISPDTHKKWKKSSLEAGDVVIVRVGYPGTACVVPPGMGPLNAASLVIVRPDKALLDPYYLAYVLNSPWGKATISGRLVGAAQQVFNTNTAAETRIPAPPIEIQRRIASILSAYDDLIENNTRRIAILEEMARRIYEEWFVRFRFPGHENVRMVESELGLMPKEWNSATLGSVCAYINRGLAPKYDDDAPGIVINQKCIRDQRLSLSAARRQSKVVPKEKLIVPGDVLINSTGVGTLGRVAQVLEPMESCTVDTHVSIVRPSSNIDKDFFGMAMLHRQPHFEAQGVGSTGQTELSRSRIAETEIVLPAQALQAQFGNLVSPMRQLAVRLQRKNANLRATRDLLLPKLISGELDVSDLPDPEAAAA